jgi:hypothetical protein
MSMFPTNEEILQGHKNKIKQQADYIDHLKAERDQLREELVDLKVILKAIQGDN